jgi:DNA-binding LacI/PurR family transcriptional regulator
LNESSHRKRAAARPRVSRTLIWDVAREAGVSIATVSRALNGKTDVASLTRERILRIAQEQGYVSNQHARALLGRLMIGCAVPQVHSLYFAEILQGAVEALETYEASLVVCPTGSRSEQSLLSGLLRDRVDGALLVLPPESNVQLLHLQQRGSPFVIIDPTYPVSEQLLVVAAANMAGARQASEHLLALRHRRIGTITGPAAWCATIDRLAGYRAVLTGAGLPIDPALSLVSDFTVEGGLRAAHRLLALREPPTAVFAFNDEMAVGTLQAARECGLRVPEDLSIVGFDDAAFASYTTPALTTVRQPLRELGRAGVDQLFRQLRGQIIEARRIELSTRLIARASTAPAPD